MSRRVRHILTLAAALGGLGLPIAGGALAEAPDDPPVMLQLGDRIRVEGADIGCQVARQSGQTVLDCRRAGRLKGTYGSFFGHRKVQVARFASDDTARVIFTARHGGAARRCKGATR